MNFLSQDCLAHAALIAGGIAAPPLPEQKELKLMESVTVERVVVFGNLSLLHGQWSHPQESIFCSVSRNGGKCAALGVRFFHLYSFFLIRRELRSAVELALLHPSCENRVFILKH